MAGRPETFFKRKVGAGIHFPKAWPNKQNCPYAEWDKNGTFEVT
jgi:hypothetical protein